MLHEANLTKYNYNLPHWALNHSGNDNSPIVKGDNCTINVSNMITIQMWGEPECV